eukprot:1154756-Pelagomonas_calceolata.AAC.2
MHLSLKPRLRALIKAGAPENCAVAVLQTCPCTSVQLVHPSACKRLDLAGAGIRTNACLIR